MWRLGQITIITGRGTKLCGPHESVADAAKFFIDCRCDYSHSKKLTTKMFKP